MRAQALTAALIISLQGAVVAQTPSANDDGPVEEITVTARLREEDARDVPFALTALSAPTLDARRIDDTHSLFRQLPGLALTSFDDGRFAYFQLRGIGPLSQAISPDDGSVVTYVDEVPQPVYASEFAYLDLARIELLRGPQGTLFGRNSQGGALNIVTRRPGDTAVGGVRVEGGEDGYGLVQATASGPLGADRLRGGIALRASSFDGFIPNVAPGGGRLGDRESRALRGTLDILPAREDGVRFELTANLDDQRSEPFYYVLRGQPDLVVDLTPENVVDRQAWGLSLKTELPLRAADLTLITALNGFDNEQVTDDTDGLIYGPLFALPSSAFAPPLDFSDWREKEQRFYQELRLSGKADRATAWSAGAVYFRSDFDVELDNRSTFSPFLNGDRDATQEIDSYALFGEATRALGSPRLKGTLGLRYTRDDKSLDATYLGVGFPGSVASFAQQSEKTFDLVTGRLALSWEASDTLNLYGTAGRGAKSGGFPRFTLSAALGAASESYAESTSWTYEIGAKLRSKEGRGRVEIAAFQNDVTDEQLFVLDFVSFQFLPVNLDTRAYGLEVQGGVDIGRGWTLDGGLAWTDAEIREASAISGAQPGNRVPNVAQFGSTLTLEYRARGATIANGKLAPFFVLTHQRVGKRTADVANSFDMPGYDNVDLRLGARNGRLDFYVFARNLLDEQQEINAVLYGPGVEGASYARGRVAGLGVTAAFR